MRNKNLIEEERMVSPTGDTPELEAAPPAVEERIMQECGSTESDEIYIVVRPFWLPTHAGPFEIATGKVRLTRDSASQLFPFKVVPAYVNLNGLGRYECIKPFRFVDDKGYWDNAKKGDVLELTFSEAWPLMKSFSIKPLKAKQEVEK
jgi:hypothetical protein